MDTAMKAAMLSGLVLPGVGQFFLKRYKRGLAFMLPVLAGSVALALAVVQIAAALIKAAPFQKGAIHFSDVASVAVNAFQKLDLLSLSLILAMVVVFWILSTLDAYFLGKKISSETTTVFHQ
ncbi:MAG: hypothetical protein R6W75_00110 [Smithellaceae bacterium]